MSAQMMPFHIRYPYLHSPASNVDALPVFLMRTQLDGRDRNYSDRNDGIGVCACTASDVLRQISFVDIAIPHAAIEQYFRLMHNT